MATMNLSAGESCNHYWFDTSFKLRLTCRHIGAPGWSLYGNQFCDTTVHHSITSRNTQHTSLDMCVAFVRLQGEWMGTHPQGPMVLWVSCDTAWFMGWCVPVPATGTVSAGAGAVNIMGSRLYTWFWTSNWTTGSVHLQRWTLNWTQVRFSKSSVRTMVQNQTTATLDSDQCQGELLP
jgi:hypothetical protein